MDGADLTGPVVDVELLTVERRTGVASVHAVQLGEDAPLVIGASLRLRDEHGRLYVAVVEEIAPTRIGDNYAVRFQEL
jgi:hypothetical protein